VIFEEGALFLTLTLILSLGKGEEYRMGLSLGKGEDLRNMENETRN
jgi:hypothetical protein